MDINIISIQWQLLLPFITIFSIALRWKVLRYAVKSRLTDCISWLLNLWLSFWYPVRHVHDKSSLPSVPYRFPNGQGDAAKFLHGSENSLLWQRQYGSLYRIWSGTTPEVVLTKPEHIHDVFKDSDKHLKAKNNDSGYFLGELLGKCVGLVSQSEWKQLRSVCEVPFVRSKSATYIQQMEQRTERHFRQLWESSSLSESIIDAAQDLKMLPFWIVAEILYGGLTTDMEKQLAELAPVREKLFQYFLQGGVTRYAWSKYLPTAANRGLTEFKTRWAAFNRQARDRAHPSTPIAAYYGAIQDGSLEEESILHTLDEALFANLDVTLGGISWNLVFLAAYPDVQSRLRAEIAEERAKARDGGIFDSYILRSDSYVAACISESSRLRPLAAFSVPQAAPTGRVVGGYFFPPGTNFIVDSYALNQRNEYWGEDSEKFRPERFLERSAVKDRYNFWRFGFGPRQCMGKFVADMMIRVLLVHLVENYELGMLDGDKKWERDPENWINHPMMKLKCELRENKTTSV
ncbi:Putative cytochrome P450 [Tolypocladium paradoxum]|uniref:Cytochrome P450 n=1 Tax=Tolypocladium paradoxum TaxID=94208 RepID=A0A2S4KYM3_9HYPO|nr:Putative cytochrome P450 [Tolypocladium paradoxum]